MTNSPVPTERRIGPVGRPRLSSVPSTVAWPALHRDALQGLAGDVVSTVSPYTEADPAAVLASLLAMFGSAVGRGPHARLEESQHHTNVFMCVVGDTSGGRKGTSASIARRLVSEADPTWDERVADGLVSGEGLIHHVRDGRVRTKHNAAGDDDLVVVDEGVSDKRLLVLATEFAQVLAVMRRPDNTLSPVLRTLWDDGRAQSLAKNSPERTTAAHVSVLAHITPSELRQKLDATEKANGFANRFLFIASRRSKLLSRGPRIPEEAMRRLVSRLGAALRAARGVDEVRMDDPAWTLWDHAYERLSTPPPGLLGELLARGQAHVHRLALLYALLDEQTTVSAAHLQAALALWQYAADSTRWLFGDRVGEPLADKLLAMLREAGAPGVSRTQMRDVIGHRVDALRIEEALATLLANGLARYEMRSSAGRPGERWYAASSDPPFVDGSRSLGGEQ